MFLNLICVFCVCVFYWNVIALRCCVIPSLLDLCAPSPTLPLANQNYVL